MESVNDKHIDLTYLKNIASGSNEFLSQMISEFMVQLPESLNEMDSHLNEKDWNALYRSVHKAKASFSFMGIKKLEPIIFQVEECCLKEINTDQLPELIIEIKNICKKALEELEIEKKLFE